MDSIRPAAFFLGKDFNFLTLSYIIIYIYIDVLVQKRAESGKNEGKGVK
jgi:hypothetical protein